MVKLYQFPSAFGLPNASPFCMKLDTWLRMAGLSCERSCGADLRKAPRGKMLYIEDDGRAVADSSLIIDYLTKQYSVTLDAHLTPREWGEAFALGARRRLREDRPGFLCTLPLPLAVDCALHGAPRDAPGVAWSRYRASQSG